MRSTHPIILPFILAALFSFVPGGGSPLRAQMPQAELSEAYADAARLIRSVPSASRTGAPSPDALSATPDGPLDGRILDTASGRFIKESELIARLLDARFALLGEIHDNAFHHRLQAALVKNLAARRPSVGFEMLPSDVAPLVSREALGRPVTIEDVALAWQRGGWSLWDIYRPVAEEAVAAELPILAANLSKADKEKLKKEGWSALDPRMVRRFNLDQPLPPDLYDTLRREIIESHCGYNPGEEVVAKMIMVQRAWDATMATRMASGGVLIAGNGHVRFDRGVPAYLSVLAPGETALSVGFVEVGPAEGDPAAYGSMPYHFLWFTPRVDRKDPCADFPRTPRSAGVEPGL
ncbi:MAG: ChaN family lipoprotein [Elusimicrobia bacterium]|nr:ChaN family lipoprotein [Elusimicrobiota bacterium]